MAALSRKLSDMPFPLAYFLTWTCHGARLHGDPRGSFDDRNNAVDSPLIPANPEWRAWEAAIAEPPFSLNPDARRVVRDTISAHCTFREWVLHSLNVRTEHVHIVVSCGEIAPEPVMGQFKAWCTRRLREAGLVTDQAELWTRHGSTRYLWTRQHILDAVAYVRDRQGRDLV